MLKTFSLMIRSTPPQAGQVSMSMPKTRFSRCSETAGRLQTQLSLSV